MTYGESVAQPINIEMGGRGVGERVGRDGIEIFNNDSRVNYTGITINHELSIKS